MALTWGSTSLNRQRGRVAALPALLLGGASSAPACPDLLDAPCRRRGFGGDGDCRCAVSVLRGAFMIFLSFIISGISLGSIYAIIGV